MNYGYWFSKANDGRDDNPRNGGDTPSAQGSLRLEPMRGHEQQLAGRRLAADDSFPARPHVTGLPPSSVFVSGQFDRLGGQPSSLRTMMFPVAACAEYPGSQSFVGYESEHRGASELPILNNHTVGLPLSLPGFSRSGRFAGLDSSTTNAQHFHIPEANIRRLDGILGKGYGAHNNGYYSSQLLSDYSSYGRNDASLLDNGVENMRRVLGKELNRSHPDASALQNVSSSQFTLMGEQVDKNAGTLYKQQHEQMTPHFGAHPQGLFAAGNSRMPPTWDDANFTTAWKKGYTSFRSLGSDTVMPPAGLNRKLSGTHNLLPFEVSNAAMQEALRNAGEINSDEHSAGGLGESSKSGTLKRKDRTKSDGNVFPTNVKSLLSTGIFDGVSVKYVSWDRTKNVRGTIQGTGYVCWCKDCDKKKVVNAYQLEQHAGSKSKHPNDHIYFSNGKSVYGVVQELKNTPSDKLLEVIPTITGCRINEDNLSKWKGSFKAARRELQRIFGSDLEEEPPSF